MPKELLQTLNRTPGDYLMEFLTGFPSRMDLEQAGSTLAGLASSEPQTPEENFLSVLAEQQGLDLTERPDLGVHLRAAQAAAPRAELALGALGPHAVRAAGFGKEVIDELGRLLGTNETGFDMADLIANELGIQLAPEVSPPIVPTGLEGLLLSVLLK